MTTSEMHALSVAATERRAELERFVAFYEERSWFDLAAEYKIRLAEIVRLLDTAQTALFFTPAVVPDAVIPCQHEPGQSDCERCGWMAELVWTEPEMRLVHGDR